MRTNRTTILVFVLLIIAAAFYRVWDNRPWGFAPQIAMALFAGSVIKDRKIAFLVPLLSMLISDVLYHMLASHGSSDLVGFYQGQWVNYLLFMSITMIGFFIRKNNVMHIAAGSLAGAVFFYIASNFFAWIGGAPDIANIPYPKTWDGLMRCMAAGLPFFRGSILATLFFNGIFFGSYYLYTRYISKPVHQTA